MKYYVAEKPYFYQVGGCCAWAKSSWVTRRRSQGTHPLANADAGFLAVVSSPPRRTHHPSDAQRSAVSATPHSASLDIFRHPLPHSDATPSARVVAGAQQGGRARSPRSHPANTLPFWGKYDEVGTSSRRVKNSSPACWSPSHSRAVVVTLTLWAAREVLYACSQPAALFAGDAELPLSDSSDAGHVDAHDAGDHDEPGGGGRRRGTHGRRRAAAKVRRGQRREAASQPCSRCRRRRRCRRRVVRQQIR